MQVSISSAQALDLIRGALEHYSDKTGVSVAYRIRIEAMRRMVEDMRKRSPKANVVITLDDYVLLTEFV